MRRMVLGLVACGALLNPAAGQGVPAPVPATTALPAALPAPGCAVTSAPLVLDSATWTDEGVNPGRTWVGAEYLLWWTKGSSVPPLITASPPGTPQALAGVLGAPGTTVLFGGRDLNTDLRSGGRFTLGRWLNDERTWGVEGNFFLLETATTTFSAGSTGTPILGRPFFNAATGAQDAELVAFPGVLAGTAAVVAPSNVFLGGEALVRRNLCCTGCGCRGARLDALAGYRYLQLNESVNIYENLLTTSGTGVVAQGTRINVADRFAVRNQFHGGELGGQATIRRDAWSLGLLAKFALGSTHQSASINGNTRVTVPGLPTVTNAGGLLAQGSNIGHFTQNVYAWVPEFGATVGRQLTPRLRATVGYTFLYWSDVPRPGNQIDVAVNPTQIPPGTLTGAARPAFGFQTSDFWAQGVNLGLDFRY